jgi:hypothetical protein
MRLEIARHGPTVVCDQDSVLLGRKFQQNWIFRASESGSLDIQDVDGWFARQQATNDVGVEVLIRQKADRHDRLVTIPRRAASSFE